MTVENPPRLPESAILILFAAVMMLGNATAQADASNMDAEIDFLLDTVVTSNCVFIRNGSEYKSEAARDHLQMKRERGKRYFDNTEEFIERLASKSSWSGKAYLIQCGNAPQQTTNSWFNALLVQYRSEPRNDII